MPITDKAAKAAAPKEKPYKIADGGGMYLEVMPNGSKYWRLKFRQDGKEKRLALGVYPEISIAEARDKRHEYKKLLRGGEDLSRAKKRKPMADDFYTIALDWHEKNKASWSKRHIARQMTAIEEMRPFIGNKPIDTIEAPDILEGIRKIEERKAFETAQKTKQAVGQVFYYAIAIGKARRNPAADLRGALEPKPQQINNPHLSDKDLPDFLAAFAGYKGYAVTRLAFRFLMLTFVRTKEMRFAVWDEFDLEKKQWRIPADRMKSGRIHLVPLSKQVLQILKELKQHTKEDGYLFPQQHKPDKPISENAVLTVIDAIGYKGRATGHGFRATASTILNEHGYAVDAIERQLAHVEGNKVRAAYNHAEYMPERIKMMQWWADYLDKAQGKKK